MEDRAFVPLNVIAVCIHDLRKWNTLRTIKREKEREGLPGGGRERQRQRHG